MAISTACGALNYIVVETTSDAQLCVELLRKRQLGVQTFLILEKQRHLQQYVDQRVDTPDGGGCREDVAVLGGVPRYFQCGCLS